MGVQVGSRLRNGNGYRQPVPRVTDAKCWPAAVATPTSASPSLRRDPDNGFVTKMTNDTRQKRTVWRGVQRAVSSH